MIEENTASNTPQIDLNCLEFWITVAGVIVAFLTLIVTIIGVIVAGKIARQQKRKDEHNNLLFTVAIAYNILETDILLLQQGSYDISLCKDMVDKESLMAISKAKSYSIITKNKKLFKYLDDILTDKEKPNIGQLIDDYFEKRATIVPPKNPSFKRRGFITCKYVENSANSFDQFLKRVREERDNAIRKIKKIVR